MKRLPSTSVHSSAIIPLSKGEQKKYQIIEAAIACLATEGVENTTFESIGKRLGIGKAHVAYHFPKKSDILLLSIRHMGAISKNILQEKLSASVTPMGRIIAYVEAQIEWIEKYPLHPPVLFLFYYYCTFDSSFKALYQEIRKQSYQLILESLKQIPYLEKSDVAVSAKVLQAAIAGIFLEHLTSQEKRSSKQLRKEALMAIRKCLDVEGELE